MPPLEMLIPNLIREMHVCTLCVCSSVTFCKLSVSEWEVIYIWKVTLLLVLNLTRNLVVPKFTVFAISWRGSNWWAMRSSTTFKGSKEMLGLVLTSILVNLKLKIMRFFQVTNLALCLFAVLVNMFWLEKSTIWA